MIHQNAHIPVLFEESLTLLNPRPGETIVDGTLGGCGHAGEILKRIDPGGRLVGIDRDKDAIERAQRCFGAHKDNVDIVRADFEQIREVLEDLGIRKVDGALLDLGVSSFQLEDESRGFSYMQDAPLDMRMDVDKELDARTVVNTYDEAELERILREYGEEHWAARIAHFICTERKRRPIETTGELVSVIKAAVPKNARRNGPHPAKRTFQAIRIEVNQELSRLSRALEDYVDVLAPGGRLCVITFHSLEDRIVKHTFRALNDPCTCPKEMPCVCGKKPLVRILTKRPIMPADNELKENPRSRSAKLRGIERI